MKKLIMAFFISMAIIPARAQFFKKLKEETTQRLKEKMEMKKSQKIDETTEKASTKAMSVPDSLVQKTARAMKPKKHSKTDSTEAPIPQQSIIDSTIVRPAQADTATTHS
ncbi:MAG: hypothetical protein JST68_24150 [Bacteroidetes bacterium]|nr:hypothetical protein [Bacteroidota bacterium]